MGASRGAKADRGLTGSALGVSQKRPAAGDGGCNAPQNPHEPFPPTAGCASQSREEILQVREDIFEAIGGKSDIVPQRVDQTTQDTFPGRPCGVFAPQLFC